MRLKKTNDIEPSYPKNLTPLFEAMKARKTIKSVTCMAGTGSRKIKKFDFEINDFKAVTYTTNATQNDKKPQDFVEVKTQGAHKKSFYMSWVKNFEL